MQTATATPDRRPGGAVGHLLREWRAARGMSQLDLAMHAGFSARHVSFIETGRAQPSRQALLVLAEALEVPLRDRNRLLDAGGFANVYQQTPLAADDMAHIRAFPPPDRHCFPASRPGSLLELPDGEPAFIAVARGHRCRRFLDAEPLTTLRMTFHPLSS